MPSANTILEMARSYLGTPFRHQGRWRHRGVDCIGLIICTAQQIYHTTFDIQGYPPEPNVMRLTETCAAYMQPVRTRHAAQSGDIVVLRFIHLPMHMGFLADKGRPFSLIHACARRGKVIEHRLDQTWISRIAGVFRLPEIWDGPEGIQQWRS